jgi:2'-5' RNA ligase
MSERWRCFIAVPVEDELQASLAAAIAAWRDDPRTEGLRWVAHEALHLTLAFLGPTEPEAIGGIKDHVEQTTTHHAPMTRTTGRLGAFARPGSARVLWYAVHDPDNALEALATDLDGVLGLGQTGPYHPHVTLARARRRSLDLRGWIEAASESAPEGTLAIRTLYLMRSHLRGGRARYETLASFPLAGHPR